MCESVRVYVCIYVRMYVWLIWLTHSSYTLRKAPSWRFLLHGMMSSSYSSKQLSNIVLRTFYILYVLRTVIPGSEFYPQRRNSGADIRKKMNCHIRRRLMINEFMKICAIVSMAIYHRYTESVIRVIEGQSIVEPQKHVQAIKNTYLHSLFPVG